MLIFNIFLVEKSGNVSSDGTLERQAEEQLEDILEPSSSPASSDVSEPSSSALDDGNGSKGPEEKIAAVTDTETKDDGKREENLSHCSTTGKPTHLFRTKCVSLDSV